MRSQTVKNIIFDYGGVIFEIEHELAARAFEELGIGQVRQTFTHAAQGELFRGFETGEISPEEFREEIRRMSRRPLDGRSPDEKLPDEKLPGEKSPGKQPLSKQTLSDEQIDNAWNAMLLGVPDGNIELLLRLKGKYRTFLLSNNNAIHCNACENILRRQWNTDIEDCMEKAYFSHLIGQRKPDAAAFEYVLDRHKLDPGETVFIDDTPANTDAAAALGMQIRLVKRNAPLHEVVMPFL